MTTKGQRNAIAILLIIVAAVAITATALTLRLSLPNPGACTPGTAGCTTPTVVGTAPWCQSANGVLALGQSFAGCFSQSLELKITLQDAYTGLALNSWGCILISGGSPGMPSAGTILKSLTSDSNGVCDTTTGSTYATGSLIYVKACSSGTSCTYSSSNTVYEAPLNPGTGATGGFGLVPWGTYQSTTPIAGMPFYVVQTGSSTGITNGGSWVFSITLPNSSVVSATGGNVYINGGAGANFGKKFTLTYNIQEKNVGSTTVLPWGLGYTSFTQYDNLNRYLQAELTVKQVYASSGDACIVTSTNLPALISPSPPGTASGVSQTGTQIPDSTTLRSVNSGNTPVSPGTYSIQVSYDCSQVTSGDTVALTFTGYFWFNLPYFQSAGTTNTEATNMLGTFVFNFKN